MLSNSLPLRRILAGSIFGLLTISAHGESFNATVEAGSGGAAANYLWKTLPWNIPGEWPGFDDANDDVTLLFREFNNLDAAGSPTVTIDLEGEAFTIGSLVINESTAGETVANFANGTLNVSSIAHTSAGSNAIFLASTTIASGATPLTITENVGYRSLIFQGAVTGTGGVVVDVTDINGRVVFSQATFGVTGGLTMSGIAPVRFDQFTTASATKTIDGLTQLGTGDLEIDRTSGNAMYSLTISGATHIFSSRLRLRAEDADGEFIFDGPITLDNNGGGVEFGTNQNRAVVRVNGAFDDTGEGDILRLAPHLITTSNTQNFGTIVIGAGVTTNRTSDTDFFTVGTPGDPMGTIGGKVVLNVLNGATTGLGAGQINVGNGISVGNHLNVAVNQGASLDVDLKAFNVISGDLTGAVFAQTATAGDELAIGTGDRIFVDGTLGLPTTDFTGGATHYLGIAANTGTFTVGDDGDALTKNDIFKGVAFGSTISTAVGGAFIGTVNTFDGTSDIPVYVLSQIFGSGAGTATFVTTGAVTFHGPGMMMIDEPSTTGVQRAINLDVIDRIGAVEWENNNLVVINDVNALNTSQTLNISHGRLDLNNAGAIDATSTVNIGDGATLNVDQTLTSGNIVVSQGGAILFTVFTGSGVGHIEGATSVTLDAGAKLIFNASGSVGPVLAGLMPQADIVLTGVYGQNAFTGAGIKLGAGKRLTTATIDNVTLTGGTGITTTAIEGETVYISAATSRTMDINDNVSLGLVDLEIGSATPLTTVVSQSNMLRTEVAQGGTINLDGNSTARNVTVRSGTLNFTGAAGTGAATFSGAFTASNANIFVSDDANAELNVIDGTFAGGGIFINDGARFEFEFDQQVGGIDVQQVFTFSGDAANSASSVQLIVDEEGGTVGANSAVVSMSQLRLMDGTTFAMSEEGSTVVFRAGLRLAGTATLLDNATAEDFDLLAVSGIDANGAVDNVGAKTLILGTGTAAGDAFNTVLSGALDANVTVSLMNGGITFAPGAVLNGKVTFVGRTGPDSDVVISAGQSGSGYLTGTGQIDLAHGEDIEALVDEANAGDPPNGALAPLLNVVNQQINLLPGETGLLRGNRGVNVADATDVFGAVHFANVHLGAGSALTLATSNSVAIRATLTLEGDASINSSDGTRVYLSDVSDPGADHNLTVTGANAVRLVGSVTANSIVVGGAVVGVLNIHPSDAQVQTVTTGNGAASYPLLPGPRTVPSLNLTDALVIGTGGVVNLGINDVETGDFVVTTGVRLSDNATLNVYTPLVVPVGKKFSGTSSNTIFFDDVGVDSGSLRLEGTLSPGTGGAGALSLRDGFVTMADGSIYEFEAGVDAANSDLVRITGSTSLLAFEGDWTLQLGATSTFDPTGKTFVLFDAATAIASGLGTWTIVNGVSGWDTSAATISIAGNDVVLAGIGVIPEPATGASLLAGLALLGCRRLRRRGV